MSQNRWHVPGNGASSHEHLAKQMTRIKADCEGDVEFIDDSPNSAPSMRLAHIIPGYDKVGWSVTAAKDVEVPVLRKGCAWLERWLSALERAAESA